MAGFIAEHRKRSNDKLVNRIAVSKGDITKVDGMDAIVTAIFCNMDIVGSLNKSIIKAAGHEFDEFLLNNIFKPKPGDSFAVPGFKLPVDNVIIVAMPAHRDNFDREDFHLLRCYRHAMEVAVKMGMKNVAYPAIGTGQYGYPVDRAVRLAFKGIIERITGDIEQVKIVCNEQETFEAFNKRLNKYNRNK